MAEVRVIKNKKAIETQEFEGLGRLHDVIPYSCGLLVCIDYRMILRVSLDVG